MLSKPIQSIGLSTKANHASPPPRLFSLHCQKILDFHEAIKKVYLECQDFEKVCRRFDSAEAMHYLDPPYFGKEKYYKEVFTEDDHYRLAKMAHELKGQVIISYYPVPEILELYPEERWERRYFEATTSIAQAKNTGGTREKRTELLLIRR